LLAVYELVPIIGDVIRAHCPGSARADFMQACLRGQWHEAKSMVEGMLAEPWFLRGYQETRLREFLDLLPPFADQQLRTMPARQNQAAANRVSSPAFRSVQH
jgi:hypothetical protein